MFQTVSVMGHQACQRVTRTTVGFQQPSSSSLEDVLASLHTFPAYSKLFRDVNSLVFSDCGPLPNHHRHFIALMVSWGRNDWLGLELRLLLRLPGLPAAPPWLQWRRPGSYRGAAARTGWGGSRRGYRADWPGSSTSAPFWPGHPLASHPTTSRYNSYLL